MTTRTIKRNSDGHLSVSVGGREFSTCRALIPSDFAPGERVTVKVRPSRVLEWVADVSGNGHFEVWALSKFKGVPDRPRILTPSRPNW